MEKEYIDLETYLKEVFPAQKAKSKNNENENIQLYIESVSCAFNEKVNEIIK